MKFVKSVLFLCFFVFPSFSYSAPPQIELEESSKIFKFTLPSFNLISGEKRGSAWGLPISLFCQLGDFISTSPVFLEQAGRIEVFASYSLFWLGMLSSVEAKADAALFTVRVTFRDSRNRHQFRQKQISLDDLKRITRIADGDNQENFYYMSIVHFKKMLHFAGQLSS